MRIARKISVTFIESAFVLLILFFSLITLAINKKGTETYGLWEYYTYLFEELTWKDVLYLIPIVVFLALIIYLLNHKQSRILKLLYNHRWLCGIIFIAFCTIFEINNSSSYVWQSYAGLSGTGTKPFWGVARSIRSDEWGVWTPLMLSQEALGFQNVIDTTSIDHLDPTWISVGGVPAFSIALFFKPFYLGFLTFGAEKGMAFLFSCRISLLFLVSFELAEYYTNREHVLSFTAATMVALAPYIQWWFSQSVSEVLIFGQGMILSFISITEAPKKKDRIIAAALFAYMLGCFILISYIGWLISMLCLVIPILVYEYKKNRKISGCLFRDTNYKYGIAFLIVCLTMIGVIVSYSWETLLSVKNSVYPGSRVSRGGEGFYIPSFISGVYNIFLPFTLPTINNQCECAGWITFAPTGTILCIYNMIKYRKKDYVALICLSLEACCYFFNIVGVPEWFAKITFLSLITKYSIVLGIAEVILLIRGISQKEQYTIRQSLWVSLLLAFIQLFCISRFFETNFFLSAFILLIHFVVNYAIFRSSRAKGVSFVSVILVFMAILGGAFVNPLQSGIQTKELSLVQDIEAIQDNNAVWLVEGEFPYYNNIPLVAGKKVVNSTQYYPNPEFWARIDKNSENKEIYNRFCHISTSLTDTETSFELLGADYIRINLYAKELLDLGVTHVLTKNQYPLEWGGIRWKESKVSDGFFVYEITNI